MKALFSILIVPFMFLNFFGGIVSGVWLVILGEWGFIGYGLALLFGGVLLIGVALLPGMLFSGPGALMYEKEGFARFFSYPLLFFGLIWTYLIMVAWAVGSFYFFMSKSTSSNLIPLLFWSYGTATGPWVYMAQKESQGDPGSYSGMTVFFLQISCIVAMVMIGFFKASLLSITIGFGIVMGIGLLFQLYLSFEEYRMKNGLSGKYTSNGF